jgi:hypothetical protein
MPLSLFLFRIIVVLCRCIPQPCGSPLVQRLHRTSMHGQAFLPGLAVATRLHPPPTLLTQLCFAPKKNKNDRLPNNRSEGGAKIPFG